MPAVPSATSTPGSTSTPSATSTPGGGGGAPWTPLNITSATLLSWHDAIGSVVDNDAAVGSISDLSPSGVTATEANVSRKGTRTLSGINGKPAFVFASGQSIELGATHATTMAGGTNKGWSIWGVYQFSGLSPTALALIHGLGNSGNSNPLHTIAAGTGVSQVWASDRRGDTGLAVSLTGSGMSDGVRYLLEVNYDGATLDVFANGASVMSAAQAVAPALTLNSSKIRALQRGATYLASGATLIAGCHITLSNPLSAGERALMYSYLSARWA